jgi:hypothetical protein
MKRKNIPQWLISTLLFPLVVALFVPCIASADPATAVSVEPASKVVGIGETFSVDILVDPDTDIAGVQFNLSFDASVVTANSITEGNLLKQGGASTFFIPGTMDNVAGTITGVAGAITTSGETVSQPGIFATISFTAGTADGISALDLSNVTVGDSQGRAVDLTVTDGLVTVGIPPAEHAIIFDTVPAAIGSITFAGISYSDGNTADKSVGTYAITAAPGRGYYFDKWETTGGLSVTSSTSATTTCTVSDAGTLKMVQTTAPPEEYAITFDTVPAAIGSITFAGISYSDGNTADKSAGTYAITAAPGSGYYFDKWETTGGLSVTSSTSATTSCTVSGIGTLRMVQTTVPPPTYAITFDTVPAATGSITFAGISYTDGNIADKSARTYAITATPGRGYYFDKWETTGGLSATSSTSATTTCEVSDAGTLRMVQTTAPPEEYAITLDTVPAAKGNITFAGVSYSDEDTVDKPAGTYAIAAVPGSGYYFDRWETAGGLSVTSSTSATTTCEVSDAGTLRMVQTTAPPEEYAITLDTVPAATGNITFDGVSYSDGNTATKSAGTYAITAAPGSGYYFDRWETAGGLSVTSSTSATTNCTVSGAGTLRMVQTTTAPPVNGTDHPISKTAILALSIAGGAAIIAGIVLLVRRRRSAMK